MLILLMGNWNLFLAKLYFCVQEHGIKKMDTILSKADTEEGLTPLSGIQYAIHSAIYDFANKRGAKCLFDFRAKMLSKKFNLAKITGLIIERNLDN